MSHFDSAGVKRVKVAEITKEYPKFVEGVNPSPTNLVRVKSKG